MLQTWKIIVDCFSAGFALLAALYWFRSSFPPTRIGEKFQLTMKYLLRKHAYKKWHRLIPVSLPAGTSRIFGAEELEDGVHFREDITHVVQDDLAAAGKGSEGDFSAEERAEEGQIDDLANALQEFYDLKHTSKMAYYGRTAAVCAGFSALFQAVSIYLSDLR